MSNVAEGTIELLQHAGIRISVEGDAIRFKGPPEALKELVPVLKEYKPILLATLQAGDKQPRTVVIDGVGWYRRSNVAGREGCGAGERSTLGGLVEAMFLRRLAGTTRAALV